MGELAVANAKRLAAIDQQKQDVDSVQIASFRAFQAAANQVMHSVRTSKTNRIRDEYDAGIRRNEATLAGLKGDLADVLTQISKTLGNINELQVCKEELARSLAEDENKCLAVNEEIEETVHKLEVYKYTLEKRKHALSAAGDMEQSVLNHVQELLLERGKDLFEGKTPMLMRQFEVLPNVYCQCAIFEDL